MNNYALVAIPLFILIAQLLDPSKFAHALFETLFVVLGGLGLAVVVVCSVFAATTGIIGASVVAMGHIYKGILPFVGLQILGLIILGLFLFIITFLPNLFFGG